MMKKILTLLLVTLVITVSGCTGSDKVFANTDQSRELTSTNNIQTQRDGSIPHTVLPKEPMPPEILDDTDAYDWVITFHTFNDNQPPQPMQANFSLWYWGEERKMAAGGGDKTDPWQNYYYELPSIQPFQDILDYLKENEGSFFDHSEFIDAIPGWYKIPTSEEWFILTAEDNQTMSEGFEYVIVREFPDDPPVSDEIAWVFDLLRELRDEVLLHPLE